MQELTNEQILQQCPSAGATHPQHEVTDKYRFIPTMDVVNIMRDEGWLPVSAEEQNARAFDRIGFQKHLIKFQRPDLVLESGEFVQAVMFNSHDRSSCYQFSVGIYRLICSNGMIAGDSFDAVHVRHMGITPGQIIQASKQIVGYAPKVASLVEEMREIVLEPKEREAFAKASNVLINGDRSNLFPAHEYLHPHRYQDDHRTDLWGTFNIVQENMMKGGVRGYNSKSERWTSTRAVKSIDRNHGLNKALFTLAEEMMKLKKGEPNQLDAEYGVFTN